MDIVEVRKLAETMRCLLLEKKKNENLHIKLLNIFEAQVLDAAKRGKMSVVIMLLEPYPSEVKDWVEHNFPEFKFEYTRHHYDPDEVPNEHLRISWGS